MRAEQVTNLQLVAFEKESALLHSMLQLRDQFASDEEWAAFAITKLVDESKGYRDRLIRLTATLPVSPILER